MRALTRCRTPRRANNAPRAQARCHVGDIAGAERALAEMQQAGLSPNVVSFSTLMAHYCREGDMSAAEFTLEQMRDAGVAADLQVRACARARFEPRWVRARATRPRAWSVRSSRRAPRRRR